MMPKLNDSATSKIYFLPSNFRLINFYLFGTDDREMPLRNGTVLMGINRVFADAVGRKASDHSSRKNVHKKPMEAILYR